MDPNKWGPHAWYFIESSIIHMPEDADISKYVDFLTGLKDILPCKGCRDNYAQHLIDTPIPKTSKKDLVDWVIKLHNEVREYQKKPQFQPSDVIEYYTMSKNTVQWIALIVLVLVVSVFVIRSARLH